MFVVSEDIPSKMGSVAPAPAATVEIARQPREIPAPQVLLKNRHLLGFDMPAFVMGVGAELQAQGMQTK